MTPDSQIGPLAANDVMSRIHPDDAERVRALVTESIKQADEDLSFDMRIRHQDGSWHDYEAVASNLLDNEAVDGIVVNARDVTERKSLEEQ